MGEGATASLPEYRDEVGELADFPLELASGSIFSPEQRQQFKRTIRRFFVEAIAVI